MIDDKLKTIHLTDADKTSYLDKSDFRTHLNYARRMAVVCANMTITTNISKPKDAWVAGREGQIKRFAKLSELTAKSIVSDINYCQEDDEYASMCAPWIPVKCYYRLYYLESILLSLKGNACGYNRDGHHTVRSVLNAELKSKTVRYNTNSNHGGIFEVYECMNFRTTDRSANIKKDFWKESESTLAVLKLVSRYKFDNWKKDKNLRTALGKKERESFFKQNVSIFDYPYQMRLKVNYKDLNFLDPERVSPREAHQFVQAYYTFYTSYSTALIKIIHDLYPKSAEYIR